MGMGERHLILSTENVKICGRTTKLEANALFLHFLPCIMAKYLHKFEF